MIITQSLPERLSLFPTFHFPKHITLHIHVVNNELWTDRPKMCRPVKLNSESTSFVIRWLNAVNFRLKCTRSEHKLLKRSTRLTRSKRWFVRRKRKVNTYKFEHHLVRFISDGGKFDPYAGLRRGYIKDSVIKLSTSDSFRDSCTVFSSSHLPRFDLLCPPWPGPRSKGVGWYKG